MRYFRVPHVSKFGLSIDFFVPMCYIEGSKKTTNVKKGDTNGKNCSIDPLLQ